MMKKVMISLIVIFCFSKTVDAQIRHVQGLKAVDVGVAFTELGIGGSVGYLMYLSGKYSGRAILTYDAGKASSINNRAASGFKLDVLTGYTFLNLGDNIFINGYGGIALSYDVVEGAENYQVNSGFNYGLSLLPEVEYFLNDKFSLAATYSVRYLFAKNYGGLSTVPTFLIRYNF